MLNKQGYRIGLIYVVYHLSADARYARKYSGIQRISRIGRILVAQCHVL